MTKTNESDATLVSAEECLVAERSPEELRKYQEADPDIRLLLEAKQSNKRPPWESVSGGSRALHKYWSQWDNLVLENKLLYRRFESPTGEKVSLQLVVPHQLKRDMWNAAHIHPLSGHMMVKKTIGRIKEKAYWSGVARDVERWCKQCKICITKKGSRSKGKAKLKQYLSGEPLQRVALDILGPLPITPGGSKYILIIGDYFSKWTEAIPIPNPRGNHSSQSSSGTVYL